MSFGSALWGLPWIAIAHYIEKLSLVQVKRNVLKKVVSRANKTPTFGEGLSGHNLGAQKKISKTQAFSTLVLTSEIYLMKWGPEWTPNVKIIRFARRNDTF
jgi:hypothetical protein